jgi:hypothetical protein
MPPTPSPAMVIRVPAAYVATVDGGTFITGGPCSGQARGMKLGPFRSESNGQQEDLMMVPAGRLAEEPDGMYVTDGTAAGVRFGPFLPLSWEVDRPAHPHPPLPEMEHVTRVGWCVVEMKGRRVYGAQVRVARMAGVAWLVCDIPDERNGRSATQLVHPDSIYALSPCDQPTARRVAAARFEDAFPLNRWELDPGGGVRASTAEDPRVAGEPGEDAGEPGDEMPF